MSIDAITAVLDRSQLVGTAKLVLVNLAWHANGDGLAWPSQETLARKSGRITVRQVRRCLQEAAAAGEIVEAGFAPRNVVKWRLAILDPGHPCPGSTAATPDTHVRVRPRTPMSGRTSVTATPDIQGSDPGHPCPTNRQEPSLEPSEVAAAEQAAVDSWNMLAEGCGLQPVQRLTASRRKLLAARLAECGGYDGWAIVLLKISQTPGLLGAAASGWRIDFDWLLKPHNFTRVSEGAYDNWDPARPANGGTGKKSRPQGRLLAGLAAAVEAREARRRRRE